MNYHFSADVGGTFTDLVMIGDDGSLLVKKILSSPPNYGHAVVAGLRSLLEESRIDPDSIDLVSHASTVATNAVLERKGARTGLITTKGFRDVLELRRMRFPDTYNLYWLKPEPLVERALRLEVDERIGGNGEIVTPIDMQSVATAVRRLTDTEHIDALAVCLINSYINPVHEQAIKRYVEEHRPDLPLSLSSEVLPEIKEYERTSTTVTNAYLVPIIAKYLEGLQQELKGLGIKVMPFVMQSAGGLMSVDAAIRFPVYVLESGPAAGVVGVVHLARALGCEQALAFDMGGTTAKAAMIENGEPFRATEYEIGAPISTASRLLKGGGYMLKIPAIDIAEVGAGGGSIVYVDSGGELHVGPRSAGADPGPVCYDRGGTEPTVTDANLVLGYLPPGLLGGELPANMEAATRALDAVAKTLRLPLMEIAYGVHKIANASMTRAIRAVSIERGRDARTCLLVVFGGSGPVHAAGIARELGIKRLLIPRSPGVFSALGLAYADIERHTVQTRRMDLHGAILAEVRTVYEELEIEALTEMAREGWSREAVEIRRYADLYYRGQSSPLRIPLNLDPPPDGSCSRIETEFQAEYERTYGHRQPDEHVILANARIVATVGRRRPVLSGDGAPTRRQFTTTHRRAYFGEKLGLIDTPIIARRDLEAAAVQGPFIIDEYDTTIVIPPGCLASLDSDGNIHVELIEA